MCFQAIRASSGTVDASFWLRHKSKIVQAKTSTAFRGGLREVLDADGPVSRRIADTKAALELRALDRFFETLAERPDRAVYGPAHVFAANAVGAVETLLISDGLFRTDDANRRRRWVGLAEEVEAQGGDVRVFSVGEVVRAIEEFERADRPKTTWFGGVDCHHTFFEGLAPNEAGDAFFVRWAS